MLTFRFCGTSKMPTDRCNDLPSWSADKVGLFHQPETAKTFVNYQHLKEPINTINP